MDVTTNGATLVGVASPITDLGKDTIPSGLYWERNDNELYIADASPQGGIVAFSSATAEMHTVFNNGSPSCQQVYDVTSEGGTIMYSGGSTGALGGLGLNPSPLGLPGELVMCMIKKKRHVCSQVIDPHRPSTQAQTLAYNSRTSVLCLCRSK